MSTPRIGSSISTISRVRAERAGEQRLLLVAAGERQDVVVHVGRADADLASASLRRARPRAAARSAGRCAARASERMPMFSAIDQSGKMPSDWRSPATSATGAVTSMPGLAPRCAPSKIASSRSVWPWPARPARPMISPAWATSSAPSACARGPGPHAQRAAPRLGRGDLGRDLLARCPRRPSPSTSRSRSKAPARVGGDHLAVAHHDDAVGIVAGPRRADARSGCSCCRRRRSGGRRRAAGRPCARRARRSARRG